jgi:peptidoglycan/LPS O-acetylase OafA/YrhL
MALIVVWSHCFALGLPQGETVEPISFATNGHYNAGNFAVMVFFVISGFLITESRSKSESTLAFLKKRIRRIYPGYLAASLICAFIIIPAFATIYDFSGTEAAKTVLANLLLRNYFPQSNVFANNYSSAVNGSLWSIPYEFWCYLAVAAFGMFGLLRKSVVISLIVLCLTARAVLDMLDKKPGLGVIGDVFGWPYLWMFVLPCFLMGSAFFLLRHHIKRHVLLAVVLLALFMLLCYAPLGRKFQQVSSQVIFPVVVAYITFFFAFSDRFKFRRTGSDNDFSYGTYLYAFPIQQIILSHCGSTNIAFPVFVLMSFVFSLLAGVVSWHLVERWFLPRHTERVAKLMAEVGQ